MADPQTQTPAEAIADALAFFADDEPDPAPKCSACDGDGWYTGHEDECHDTGDCVCSGVPVECECRVRARGSDA